MHTRTFAPVLVLLVIELVVPPALFWLLLRVAYESTKGYAGGY